MADAVGAYISRQVPVIHQQAMGKVAAVRIRESGDLGKALDELQEALYRGRDIPAIESALKKVVYESRHRGQGQNKDHDKNKNSDRLDD